MSGKVREFDLADWLESGHPAFYFTVPDSVGFSLTLCVKLLWKMYFLFCDFFYVTC